MDKLISASLQQGFGYTLFVFLLLYVLKTTGEREENYKKLLNEMVKKFDLLNDVKKNVEEINIKIEKWSE